MKGPLQFFQAEVMHARRRRVNYVFRYRVFSLLLDVDQLEQADKAHWFLSVDKPNLLNVRMRDHVLSEGLCARAWAEQVLQEGGLLEAGLSIHLLCMPRVFGLGFNPLSLWFCRRPSGEPVAVIAEVRNTFGERHCYLLAAGEQQWPLRADQAKHFHVSPFIDLKGRYQFDIDLSDDAFKVQIDLLDEQGRVMRATQNGQQVEANSAWLARRLASLFFQPLLVWGGIHWQALKIWLKGGVFHSKPAPPQTEVS